MKKFLIILITFLTGIPLVFAADGDEFTSDGVIYTVISENDKTCRTKEGIGDLFEMAAGNPNVSGTLKLPEQVTNPKNGTTYTLTEIGNASFYRCNITGSLFIPKTVTLIGISAFEGCSGIGELIIPNSRLTLQDSAFFGNFGLRIISYAETPPTCKAVNAFSNFESPLYVPKGRVQAYKNTGVWNRFDSIYELISEAVSLEDITIKANETKTLTIDKICTLPKEYTGFQLTINPPEGLTIEDIKINESYGDKFTFKSTENNGSYTVMLSATPQGSSVPSSSITENIITLTVFATRDVTDKAVGKLTVSDIVFTGTDVNNLNYTFDDLSFDVTYENVPVTEVSVSPNFDPNVPNSPYSQDPKNDDPEKPDLNDPNYPKHNQNSQNYYELFVGETITFNAAVNNDATLQEISWSPTQATDDLDLVIEGSSVTLIGKAISNRTTTLTAKAYNNTASSIEVKVVPMPIMSLEIGSDDGNKVDIDKTLNLSATVKPSEKYTGKISLSWVSDNDCLIVEESTGIVTGNYAGISTVSVTASNLAQDSKTEEIEIEVNPMIAQSVSISSKYYDIINNRHTLKVGEKLNLEATVLPSKTTNKEVEWSCDPSGNVTVSDQGVVMAVKKGAATVTATVVATASNPNPVTATYEITVEDIIYGDANDSKGVDVCDAVMVAYHIIGTYADTFCFINADVIQDESIDIADQQEIIDIALGISTNYKDNKFVGSAPSSYKGNDLLVADNYNTKGGEVEVGFRLDNAADYKSLQVDITIPNGMKVTSVETAEGVDDHSLLYKITEEGVLKVILFSLDSRQFKVYGKPLFVIKADAERNCGDMEFGKIIAISTRSEKYELNGDGGCREDTSSLDSFYDSNRRVVGGISHIDIVGEVGDKIYIYDLTGRMISSTALSNTTTSINLEKGIYLVNLAGNAHRVIVR